MQTTIRYSSTTPGTASTVRTSTRPQQQQQLQAQQPYYTYYPQQPPQPKRAKTATLFLPFLSSDNLFLTPSLAQPAQTPQAHTRTHTRTQSRTIAGGSRRSNSQQQPRSARIGSKGGAVADTRLSLTQQQQQQQSRQATMNQHQHHQYHQQYQQQPPQPQFRQATPSYGARPVAAAAFHNNNNGMSLQRNHPHGYVNANVNAMPGNAPAQFPFFPQQHHQQRAQPQAQHHFMPQIPQLRQQHREPIQYSHRAPASMQQMQMHQQQPRVAAPAPVAQPPAPPQQQQRQPVPVAPPAPATRRRPSAPTDDYNYSGDEADYFEASNRYIDLYDPDSILMQLVNSYDWMGALKRVASFPKEIKVVGEQGRTPLHVACDHDAPVHVVGTLLRAYPEASRMVGTSNMNPLHITCSSSHASVQVVRTLLEGGYREQTSMKDVDGDTPLHAAARCGAPIEVMQELLRANPAAVDERDHEGLTPMLRLWVRYFVILGDDVIDNVKSHADLVGELGEAWARTIVLLQAAHRKSGTTANADQQSKGMGSRKRSSEEMTAMRSLHDLSGRNQQQQQQHSMHNQRHQSILDIMQSFQVLHAACAVDCPRAVVKIATALYSQQLQERDEKGMTPLLIACQAPVFQVRDLSDGGYTMDDQVLDEDNDSNNGGNAANANNNAQATAAVSTNANTSNTNNNSNNGSSSSSNSPSVIDILVTACAPAACLPDITTGRLPLHHAIASGKKWDDGIKALLEANPDSIHMVDPVTGLLPAVMETNTTTVDTCFRLLREDPSILLQAIQ